jgi:two-component system response regulator HupR/HoxA
LQFAKRKIPHRDMKWTVLVVDDEAQVQASLQRCLEDDYRVLAVGSGSEALQLLEREPVDLVLCDQRMPEMTGVEFLREIRGQYPEVLRVLITGYTDPDDMIEAINTAAICQYVSKPWHPEQLRLLVKQTLEGRELARRHRYLSRELRFSEEVLQRHNDDMVAMLQGVYQFDKLVFASELMVDVCARAKKAAATSLPLLIQGESGTGKELLARAVHFFSPRSAFPFLSQDCGPLSDDLLYSELFGHARGALAGAVGDHIGLLAQAHGGTVFLDEVSQLSPASQLSLLRFLQSGEVQPLGTEQTRACNVRIIAASNRSLRELVESGSFRRDLYESLRGFEIRVPALRERTEDIAVIAGHAAQKHAQSLNRRIAGISADVIQRLVAYPFPGNVRELENEMRRMVAVASDEEMLSVKHLSPELARSAPEKRKRGDWTFLSDAGTLKDKVQMLESRLVEQALLRNRWNHSRAARELGLSRVGLANKVKRYKLDRKSIAGPNEDR